MINHILKFAVMKLPEFEQTILLAIKDA